MFLLLTDFTGTLERRAYGYCVRNNRYGNYRECKTSVWSRLGRWILAAVMVFFAIILIALTLCCIIYRKRKNRRIQSNSAPTNSAPQAANNNYAAHYYQPSPDAPPKYSGPESYGGVAQPQHAYVQ